MNEQELINIAKRRQQAYKARRDPATKQSNAMKMLSLHIEKGLTYAAIGQRFGVSRQRVHQMIKEVTK